MDGMGCAIFRQTHMERRLSWFHMKFSLKLSNHFIGNNEFMTLYHQHLVWSVVWSYSSNGVRQVFVTRIDGCFFFSIEGGTPIAGWFIRENPIP